jgi:hypothetical protein
MLRPTVSWPVGQILLLSDSCRFVDVGHPLWWEDVSVIYNCCWPSPAHSHLGPGFPGVHAHILLCQIQDSPNLGGQVLVFISPRYRVAQLPPQALGYYFVTYNSLGYGGGIQTCRHMGCLRTSFNDPHHIASGQTARRLLLQQFLYCCMHILWCNMCLLTHSL